MRGTSVLDFLVKAHCLLFIFFLPWERLANLESLGTISRVVGVLLAGLWVFRLARDGIRRPQVLHALTFLFFLLNFASILWTVDGEETASRSFSYLSVTIMMVIFWDVLRDMRSIRQAFQALVLGGLMPSYTVVKNYLLAQALQWGRYTTGADNENTTAYTLAITIPFAIYLILRPLVAEQETNLQALVRRGLWLLNLLYVPFCLYAIALTGTRFAMIMMFPLAAYLLYSLLQTRPAVGFSMGLVGVATLVVLPQILPMEIVERLASTGNEISSGDLNGRLLMWKIAAQTFADHPILGTGGATSKHASIPYIGYAFSTHNSFLAILAELGVVGMSLATAIMFVVVRYAWFMPRWDANFWLMVLSMWFLGNLPLTNFHNKPTWLIFGLITCVFFALQPKATGSPAETAPVDPAPMPSGVEPAV